MLHGTMHPHLTHLPTALNIEISWLSLTTMRLANSKHTFKTREYKPLSFEEAYVWAFISQSLLHPMLSSHMRLVGTMTETTIIDESLCVVFAPSLLSSNDEHFM